MDKINKFSQAIRLGATFKPQGFGAEAMYSTQKSCVLAAASDALGITDNKYHMLRERFPALDSEVSHPTIPYRDNIWTICYVLNDQDHWSREKIANWLEKQGL
jgi:hypothetical protein